MRDKISDLDNIVIKVGSNILTTRDGKLNSERIESFSSEVKELVQQGRNVVIISSGAVAAGVGNMNISYPPGSLPEFQAAAASGQITLMNNYYAAFKKSGLKAAQILLTREDFNDRKRYLNIRNCIRFLTDNNIIPIINENDSVSVDELKFGDNDLLAGCVTTGLMADILIILTSVPGLHRDRSNRDEVISEVTEITTDIENMVYDETTAAGTGGMSSKIETAKMVTSAGEPVILADGRKPGILKRIFKGEEVGTMFTPHGERISGRKRWLAFSAKSCGSVVIDRGAARAVTRDNKSLLPAGVTKVEGNFEGGEMISIKSSDGNVIAKGLSNYSNEEIEKIKGKHSSSIEDILGFSAYNEIVHRDNLVLEYR